MSRDNVPELITATDEEVAAAMKFSVSDSTIEKMQRHQDAQIIQMSWGDLVIFATRLLNGRNK